MNAGLRQRILLLLVGLMITQVELWAQTAPNQSDEPIARNQPALTPAGTGKSGSGKTQAPKWDLNIVQGALVRNDGKKVEATLGNVIDYLREATSPANVVLAPGVANVKIGDLKLASFDWSAALEALRVASGNAFTWSRGEGDRPTQIDPSTGLPISRNAAKGQGGSSLSEELLVLRPDPASENANPNRVVEVFNLGGYLHTGDRQKIDENLSNLKEIILQTIEEFRGPGGSGGKQPSLFMRFHSGASLLVATGTPAEVEVARKVILALPDASASRAQDSRADRQAFLRRYGMMPSGEATGSEPPPPRSAPLPQAIPDGASVFPPPKR